MGDGERQSNSMVRRRYRCIATVIHVTAKIYDTAVGEDAGCIAALFVVGEGCVVVGRDVKVMVVLFAVVTGGYDTQSVEMLAR